MDVNPRTQTAGLAVTKFYDWVVTRVKVDTGGCTQFFKCNSGLHYRCPARAIKRNRIFSELINHNHPPRIEVTMTADFERALEQGMRGLFQELAPFFPEADNARRRLEEHIRN